MEFKEIGKTGVKIPSIIFGTSALGNLYSAIPDVTKINIVDQCTKLIKQNIVFDSAGKYGAGLALEMLGKSLHELNIGSENIIISNKLGWIRKPLTTPEPTFEPGIWQGLKFDAEQQISYNGILKCWEQGNELLGTKYRPQLLSVHDPDEYMQQGKTNDEKENLFLQILDAYKALNDLKKQGKVKAIGVGAKDWKIIRKISEHVELDWIMIANSMTIFRHPSELLEFMEKMHKKNIAIINSAVFHAGFLTGGHFFDYKHIKPDSPENIAIFQWREKFFSICMKYNISPSVACVQFALTPPGVISISLNSSNPQHVKKNIDSVLTKIPKEFYIEMKSNGLISKEYPYIED
jgi:D-threo-aldose 1-dehydrogenase